jgi:hypothetical protein
MPMGANAVRGAAADADVPKTDDHGIGHPLFRGKRGSPIVSVNLLNGERRVR